MIAFTTNQWAILVMVLVLGWLLGLASRSGGGKWRRQLEEERAERAAIVAERDELRARIEGSNARIADLEKRVPPTSGLGAGTIGAAVSGRTDDLSLIDGIGRGGETRLNELGFHRYAEIAALSDHDAAELEGRLGADPGLIAHERWREQAAELRDGRRR
jgi:predicted flap endonuclease-1-like 5' DNA nuclease